MKDLSLKILILFLLLFSSSLTGFSQASFYMQLADSALTLTYSQVRYDPAYYRLAYPGGDVPSDRGVCTDVVIRAYRMLGIDLQREVHEDMKSEFDAYPKIWGAGTTDTNIDHRRVPNLMTFFGRKGQILPLSRIPGDYRPGDLVCWDLGANVTHIGILSAKRSADGERYLVIHNIGAGQVLEDCLFRYRITGHYRYGEVISEGN